MKWWKKILFFGISGLSIITPTILSSCSNNNTSDATQPDKENAIKYINPIFVPDDNQFFYYSQLFNLIPLISFDNPSYTWTKKNMMQFLKKYDGIYDDITHSLLCDNYDAFKEITKFSNTSYLFYNALEKEDITNDSFQFDNKNINLDESNIDKLSILLKINWNDLSELTNKEDYIYISQIELEIRIKKSEPNKKYYWNINEKKYYNVIDILDSSIYFDLIFRFKFPSLIVE